MRVWVQLVFGASALAVTTVPMRAAEQITLRDGREMTCHHHTAANNVVRLYMGASSDSYIEFPGNIASVENVPDPPPMPDPAPAVATPVTNSAAPRDANLSPTDLSEMLAKAGHEHNVDRDLLASVVKAESGGNARAVSRAGAQGLMQLMPHTAADLGVADSFRPEQNVRGGSTYLDELLTRYHDNLALALAAYNAGPAAVDKYHGIPPYRETKLYVARVIHEFNRRVKARQSQLQKTVASASVPGN